MEIAHSDVTLCSWISPAPSAGNNGLYLSRFVSAKQSSWPRNPVDYRIWRLMQKSVYIVQDTCPRHQRLDWLTRGQAYHKTLWSCWSMEKAVVYMHEGKRTSLWTSAKLKLALVKLSEPTHNTTGPSSNWTRSLQLTFSCWTPASTHCLQYEISASQSTVGLRWPTTSPPFAVPAISGCANCEV